MTGRRANARHAIALAGAVMALTPLARAETSPAATAAATPVDMVPPSIAAPPSDDALSAASAPAPAPAPAGTGTPLVLRPSKPLELAHEPPESSIGWKLVALAVVVAGGAYYARKKLWVAPTENGQLTIVRRATVGFRSELLVVNVEGQRLLLGVTPTSIQSLAVLDSEEPSSAILERSAPGATFGDRFAAMLDAAEGQSASRVHDAGPPAAATAPATEKPAPRARKARAANTANTGNASKGQRENPAPSSVRTDDEEPDVGSQARGLLALRRPR